MKYLGLAAAGTLAAMGFLEDGEYTFFEMLAIVSIPAIIDAWVRLRIARIEQATAALVGAIQEDEE